MLMINTLKIFLAFSLCLSSFTWAGNSPKHSDEFWIGLYLANQIEEHNTVLDKHKDIDRIMTIAMRIVDQAGKGQVYNISIIKAPVANAFALPGGFIFITDKLLDLKLNDGELAFLLGHELSHVQERHFERIQKEQTKVSFMNALATIGAILLAANTRRNDYERLRDQGALSNRGGAPGQDSQVYGNGLPPFLAPILAGNIFGTLYLLHSQREFEYEADIAGARLAMQAGYSLEDGLGMLKKLFYSNYRDTRYESWTTHPLTQGRLQALKDKADPKWSKPKAPEAYIEQLRFEQAKRCLDIYEQIPLWERPSFMKDVSGNDLRPILIRRARLLCSEPELQQRALSLEIKHELMPSLRKTSVLLAQHGVIEQKWLEFEKCGGQIPEEILAEAKQNAAESLKVHREQLERASPGYQKLDFLLKNFPDAQEAKDWKWQRWILEPKPEKLFEQAPEFLENSETATEAKNVISKLCLRDQQKVWVYRKGCELLQQEPEPEILKKCLAECKDIEDLVHYQSDFEDDDNIQLILTKKRELLDQAYRAGRLAGLSQQPEKAIEHYREILLYDSGSDREEDVREQIYRLNTLKSKTL
jgi:Zn-dependent protease with chaperone function